MSLDNQVENNSLDASIADEAEKFLDVWEAKVFMTQTFRSFNGNRVNSEN